MVGVLVRPFRVNEAWWACGGALAMTVLGYVSLHDAGAALLRGLDVYFFLAGMMALAEYARAEGVFAWLAAAAVRAAGRSRSRLLTFVYVAGALTTALLSNDATIVVLTPAVLAALAFTDAPAAPYLFACALIANAASTALPIANPSNLLVYADGMPPLLAWFASYGLSTIAAVLLTFAVLRTAFRRELAAPLTARTHAAPMPARTAWAVLGMAAAALIAVAAAGGPIGTVTAACGAGVLVARIAGRRSAGEILGGIAWPIIVLTAALFVVVAGIDDAGAAALPRSLFRWAATQPDALGRAGVGFAAALASNVLTNLPVAVDIGRYVGGAHPPAHLTAAALLGINIGPNLTPNGSLATILWLAIVRRAGIAVSLPQWIAIGTAATIPALVAALLLTR